MILNTWKKGFFKNILGEKEEGEEEGRWKRWRCWHCHRYGSTNEGAGDGDYDDHGDDGDGDYEDHGDDGDGDGVHLQIAKWPTLGARGRGSWSAKHCSGRDKKSAWVQVLLIIFCWWWWEH